MAELELRGCSPEPLMAYLKALGVFRLVAEQKDADVRACWRNETFVLYTTLDGESLVRFFLDEYCPTPIVAPWNGGSGFYPKDNRDAINAVLESESPRLESYRQIIRSAHHILKELDAGDAGKKAELKERILADCRNTMPEQVLPWLDAAYVLTTDGPRYPPLLGTGGNDGRLEFSNNFMQNLVSAVSIPPPGPQKRGRRRGHGLDAHDLLVASLFGDTSPSLVRDRTSGQFNPSAVGGPNATTGFEAESLTNPWDYVLMIEGALFFAGAVARRLSPESRTKAVFPFTVDTSAVGYGTAVDSEYTGDGSRAELWAPLWTQPASFRETEFLFSEGRAQLGRRQASTGTDFARAVVGLGVERGVSEFQRFGFLKRNGLAFIATPLGRLRVKPNPEVDLLFEVDGWIERLRSTSRGQDAPAEMSRVLREIDRAILEFCVHGGPHYLQEVLIALGRAEAWLGRAKGLKSRPRPLSGLSPAWLHECDDGSVEFRLAAALASIQGDDKGRTGPFRVNLEPVVFEKGRWDWAQDDTSIVWHPGDVPQAMAAVLERRCLEAQMKSLGSLPLGGKVSARLQDIRAFIEGRVDDRRIADLALPLAAINFSHGTDAGQEDTTMLPLAYATLKLLFLPYPFRLNPKAAEIMVRPEPSILPLLRAGRIKDAYEIAARRLFASGLSPIATSVDIPPRTAPRLAAALLLPVPEQGMFSLASITLARPAQAS